MQWEQLTLKLEISEVHGREIHRTPSHVSTDSKHTDFNKAPCIYIFAIIIEF